MCVRTLESYDFLQVTQGDPVHVTEPNVLECAAFSPNSMSPGFLLSTDWWAVDSLENTVLWGILIFLSKEQQCNTSLPKELDRGFSSQGNTLLRTHILCLMDNQVPGGKEGGHWYLPVLKMCYLTLGVFQEAGRRGNPDFGDPSQCEDSEAWMCY